MENNIREEIAKAAYELYEKSGSIQGRDMNHWLEAEKIVTARQKKGTQKAKPKAAAKAAAKKGK
jgi:hypothetical protein